MHENSPRTNTETFSSMISTIVCDTTATNTVEFNFSAAKTVTSGMYLNNNVTYRQCYTVGASALPSLWYIISAKKLDFVTLVTIALP